MTRLAVFAGALAFVIGFAYLTIEAIATEGLSVPGVIAVVVVLLLMVGLLGALRHPPR